MPKFAQNDLLTPIKSFAPSVEKVLFVGEKKYFLRDEIGFEWTALIGDVEEEYEKALPKWEEGKVYRNSLGNKVVVTAVDGEGRALCVWVPDDGKPNDTRACAKLARDRESYEEVTD